MRTAQALLISLFLTNAAAAQTLEEQAWLRLPDTTPRSTRAMALGGASDALGDADISANPATLANVKRPTFLVQAMHDSVGAPHFPPRTSENSILVAEPVSLGGNGVSQMAAVIPLRTAVLGVYYAAEPRLAGLDPLLPPGSGAYALTNCLPQCSVIVPVVTSAFERLERRYGVAMAWERGAIAFGAGAEMQWLRQETQTPLVRGLLLPGGLAMQPERASVRIAGRSVVPNAGLRWRVTPRLALSAAYNGAGSYERTWSSCSTAGYGETACNSTYMEWRSEKMHMADALRAGFSYAANDRLRLVAEAVRRKWSRISDPVSIFGRQREDWYEDATELHAGAEYKLAVLPLALRAGWWRDPARLQRGLTMLAESVTHRTVGAAIDVGHGARIDAAFDDASLRDQRRAVVGLAFGLW